MDVERHVLAACIFLHVVPTKDAVTYMRVIIANKRYLSQSPVLRVYELLSVAGMTHKLEESFSCATC